MSFSESNRSSRCIDTECEDIGSLSSQSNTRVPVSKAKSLDSGQPEINSCKLVRVLDKGNPHSQRMT